MAPDEPVLSVAAGGLGSVLGIERFGELLLQVPEAEEKALKGPSRASSEILGDRVRRSERGHTVTNTSFGL